MLAQVLSIVVGLGQAGAPRPPEAQPAPQGEFVLRPEFPGVLKGVDPSGRHLTLQLELPRDVEVLRDGAASSLGRLERGDELWVEYDPETGAVTTLSAHARNTRRCER